MEVTRKQRLTGLEDDARQPRLATEADVTSDKKTRKRTEDAAADRTKHGDSCSAKKVNAGLTSAKAVSLIREDTHANTCRWFTAQRHSLYRN